MNFTLVTEKLVLKIVEKNQELLTSSFNTKISVHPSCCIWYAVCSVDCVQRSNTTEREMLCKDPS